MKKIRIAVGGISIALFFAELFHAMTAGMFTFLTGGDRAGIAALALAVMLFAGGMLSILMRNNELGGIVSGGLFTVGCLCGTFLSGSYPLMLAWAGWCLIAAAVMFVTSALIKMRRPLTPDEAANLKLDFRHSPLFPAIVAMLLILAACVLIFTGERKNGTSTQKPADIAAAEAADSQNGSAAEGTDPDAEPEIAEQLIYDDNQVTITATGLSHNSAGYTVSLLIENNSILDLGFNAHAYAVNGIMSRNNIYEMNCEVPAGKKANVEMTIKESILTDYGITAFRCLDVLFWAYDNDTYLQAFTTGQLEIRTSLYNGKHDTIACRSFYESGGISVGLVDSASDSCRFCITNETGDYLDFDFASLSVNNVACDEIDSSLLGETLLNDCQIICTVPVSADFRRNNDIQTISSMQWTLKLRVEGDETAEASEGPILYAAGSTGQLSTGTVLQSPFTDVTEDDYYYDAVLWAVGQGISSGVSDTSFAPDADCTRAQMVSFLWRMAGSPKPSSNTSPFTDVLQGSSAYDAILWAWEQGISSGVTDTTFMPDASITRAQAVTMLWIYAGSPEPEADSSSFLDVNDSTAYFYQPVLWANEQGIASGKTETEFAPGDTCSRAQVVTFLYNYHQNIG